MTKMWSLRILPLLLALVAMATTQDAKKVLVVEETERIEPDIPVATAKQLTGTSSCVTDTKSASSLLDQAKADVEREKKEAEDIAAARKIRKSRNPSEIIGATRKVRGRTVELVRSRQALEKAVRTCAGTGSKVPLQNRLSAGAFNFLIQISDCISLHWWTHCNQCYQQKYRTCDGSCNNLWLFKRRWGSNPYFLPRLMDDDYDDGFSLPVDWYGLRGYPSAREVSRLVLFVDPVTDDCYSHMFMQWGQFLDHDMSITPIEPDNAHCNILGSCANNEPCFPIPIPADDERNPPFGQPCLPFTRSAGICGTGTWPFFFARQQANQLTSYIDASNVYGSSCEERDCIRDPAVPYKLRVTADNLLPNDDCNAGILCPTQDESGGGGGYPNGDPTGTTDCFLAGDIRANEQIGLTSLHTLWVREHNRIAMYLKSINGLYWDDNTIYEETRKIVYAQMQHITYKHWLSKVLGPTVFNSEIGSYTAYDTSIQASIRNEFATAAFRFGHTTVNNFIWRLQQDCVTPIVTNTGTPAHLPLHRAFFAPDLIRQDGGIDPILLGLICRSSKFPLPNENMNKELIDKLFELNEHIALDLAALNIQRGRDHGLQRYYKYREEFCGLSSLPNSFDDPPPADITPVVWNKLSTVYNRPQDIDLFAGGVAETILPGARVGATFACIIAKQFKWLRDGDRFWHEKSGEFTAAQLAEIKKTSLGSVICQNTGITQVQSDVFLRCEEFKPCDQIPKIDLSKWRTTTPGPCHGNWPATFASGRSVQSVADSSCCPDGYKHHNGRCFKLVTKKKKKTQTEAQQICASKSSKLAMIDSDGVRDFIVREFPGKVKFWIGLKRANRNSQWTWLNGGATSYTNWKGDPQPPKPPNKRGNCVFVGTKKDPDGWINKNCNHKLTMFLCERQC